MYKFIGRLIQAMALTSSRKQRLSLISPNETVNSLSEIDLKALYLAKKRGIILDLDNTITPWNQYKVNHKAHNFIHNALQLKYKICLLSNASRVRTGKIAKLYNLPYVAAAFKPRKKPFQQALQLLNLENNEVMVIGDQLFTDILGGNRINCYTILVNPLEEKEFIGTKLMRMLEKAFR